MSEETPPPGHNLNGGTFVGAKDPMWDLDRERPWHRMACYLFALGDTAKSVATKLDKSLPAVHNLIRQPWAQKHITQLMAESGQKDITKLFKAEQFNCYSVLSTMIADPNTPAALRLRAAQDMLDRSMGKATQRVEMSHEVVSDDPVAEYNRIESENKRLRKELGSAEGIRRANGELAREAGEDRTRNKGEEWKTGAGSLRESGLAHE